MTRFLFLFFFSVSVAMAEDNCITKTEQVIENGNVVKENSVVMVFMGILENL